MLSFELTNEGRAIQVICDSAGIGELIKALGSLINARGGHVHLCSPSAGGNILSDTTPYGDAAICEVILDYVEGDPMQED